jgi:hypothetical protein
MVHCVIEGDDGLARYPYGAPPPLLYEQCGLKMKLEIKPSVSLASFCGIVFDEDSLDALTDVRKHLIKTGWLKSRYVCARSSKKLMLLRAKAFSLAHQYNNCPVLRHYADYILRKTKHMHQGMLDYMRKTRGGMSQYEYDMYLLYANKNLPPPPKITTGSRQLIETLFSVPVESQIKLEEYFENCEIIQPIPVYLYLDFTPVEWIIYSQFYIREVDENSREQFHPLQFPSRGWQDVPPSLVDLIVDMTYQKEHYGNIGVNLDQGGTQSYLQSKL